MCPQLAACFDAKQEFSAIHRKQEESGTESVADPLAT
jgi:hypothetical protein